MRGKSEARSTPEQLVKDSRRATSNHEFAEEKIWNILERFLGERKTTERCR